MARVVALFTALNLLTVLIFTLLVPARPFESAPQMPLQNPNEAFWRIGIALGIFAAVLLAIRPGQRRAWELVLIVAFGAGVLVAVTFFYLPFLALGLIPVVARYWLPLWAVLLLVLGLVGFSGWWASREPWQITFEIVTSPGPLGTAAFSTVPTPVEYPNLALSFFVFIAFVFAGYALFTLEMLVRKTRAREELETTRRELEQASRQAGVLEERQRLAREIHDTLAQDFASVVVQLEAAEAAQSAEQPHMRYLEQARAVARDGLSEARRMVWALRPEILENSSLGSALERFLKRWGEENHVKASLTLTGDPSLLSPELEVGLLRITQEALSNVRKHARARQVNVTLSYLDDMVLLDIQDDGLGLQPPSSGSFGLRSMRERIEALGGSFALESEPGQGTTVAVGLPLSVQSRPDNGSRSTKLHKST
ncbi:MAG: sensor histidine kinase [Meiothermus sp.]|nr:sensor histidine kinase [Meiothermus sp.]